MLSPIARLPQVQRMIDQKNYFVIHAPRQIGKTTAITSLAQQITAAGKYTAIVLSVEVGAPFSQDIALISFLRQLRDGYKKRPHAFPQSITSGASEAIGLIGMRDCA